MLSERSWASSMMIALYRESVGSWLISASMMPSVMSLILESLPTSDVKRTW